MDFTEANFRVVLRTHDDGLGQAIGTADNLILFGGHGVGTAPPEGGPLPEVDTWSIYAKAEGPEEARRMVEDAVSGLERVAAVVEVQPFSPE